MTELNLAPAGAGEHLMTTFKPTHRLDSDDLAELEHEFDSRVYDGRYGLFHMVDGSSLVHPMSNATALPRPSRSPRTRSRAAAGGAGDGR